MVDALDPAVFIDRDGTIIHDADYCSDPQQVKLLPRIAEALKRLRSHGFKLIIITNQSGIGRGFFSLEQYRAVEAEILRQLGNDLVDATYFCPHLPDDRCDCRKPESGMILQAAEEHRVDLRRSFLIGDKESDAECGRNAGVRTIRVRTGLARETSNTVADWVAEDLPEAVEIILNQQS
ncbi:MAG TPA: HAD family hydrolase [Candidatus Udaeobacter sp.]|jgi:D-glycero-D-manno-heptose 1,7-bisphosphate phosphatase|nr:HAD family hydrolase [Candidatus Udaeobacter sp.]